MIVTVLDLKAPRTSSERKHHWCVFIVFDQYHHRARRAPESEQGDNLSDISNQKYNAQGSADDLSQFLNRNYQGQHPADTRFLPSTSRQVRDQRGYIEVPMPQNIEALSQRYASYLQSTADAYCRSGSVSDLRL